jgi:hypothetical protein
MKALGIVVAAALLGASAAAGALVPTPIGAGRLFHPGPTTPAVAAGKPVRSMTCAANEVPRMGVHLELFARGRVVIVPAGIGIAPPLARRSAYVVSGRCSYPLRTREPTGVIEVARSGRHTLGEFFAVWGRALSPSRLAGFRTAAERPVRAYVDGRPYDGTPSAIVLRRHAEIVLELGAYVPPHSSYRFRKGL